MTINPKTLCISYRIILRELEEISSLQGDFRAPSHHLNLAHPFDILADRQRSLLAEKARLERIAQHAHIDLLKT